MPCRVPIQNASPTCSCPSHKSTQNTINNSSLGKSSSATFNTTSTPQKNIFTQEHRSRHVSLSLLSSSSIHNLSFILRIFICFPEHQPCTHTQRYPAISTKPQNEIINLPHQRLRPFRTHRPLRRSRRSRRSYYSRRHNLRRRRLSQPLLSSQYLRYGYYYYY